MRVAAVRYKALTSKVLRAQATMRERSIRYCQPHRRLYDFFGLGSIHD